MTWPAALPAAALRVMRTAAARRVLQVALLVGGLFALGFLSGEQAHAAEGASAASSSTLGPLAPVKGVRSLTEHTVDGLVHAATAPADRHAVSPAGPCPETPAKHRPTIPAKPAPTHSTKPRPAGPAEPKPTDPVGLPPADTDSTKPSDSADPHPAELRTTSPSDAAKPPVAGNRTTPPTHHDLSGTAPLTHPGTGDQILEPVTDGVVHVVGARVPQPVGDLVVAVTGELGKATAEIPPLSSLPALPIFPSVPGPPSVPGQTLPLPVPQPGGAGQSAADGGSAHGVHGRSGAGAVSGATYGPRFAVGADGGHGADHRGGQRAVGAGHVPARQAPGGDPTGELGSRSAVDNGASRHVDAYAVALNQRAPLLLLTGVATRTDAAATQDRHRDVPVSPPRTGPPPP